MCVAEYDLKDCLTHLQYTIRTSKQHVSDSQTIVENMDIAVVKTGKQLVPATECA